MYDMFSTPAQIRSSNHDTNRTRNEFCEHTTCPQYYEPRFGGPSVLVFGMLSIDQGFKILFDRMCRSAVGSV